MEISGQQVERIGALLIEGGKLLFGALCGKEAGGLFDGEQAREARQISDELMKTTIVLKFRDATLHDIAKEAREVLDGFDKSSSSSGGGRGVLQNILRRYACVLNRYKLSIGSTTTTDTETDTCAHQLEYIVTCLESYGIREPCRSSWRGYDTEGEKFVGLERDVELLVDHLVSTDINDNDRCVVAICGMGGLGKSAMARHILKHPSVQHYFSASSSVRMGRSRQRKILPSLLPEKRERIHSFWEDMIAEELIRDQQNKRYLVVLDDMWSEHQWDSIKDAFPIGLGTKFLVTTRNIQLAKHVDPGAFIYQQRFLSEEESWELFKHRLDWDFLHTRLLQSELNDVEQKGRNMISRCLGLPFPIVTLAKLMRPTARNALSTSRKLALSEWEMLHPIIESYTIGDIDMGNGTLSEILDFSYQDLSSNELQSCFLYLCNIPRDYEIEAEKLCQLWIAERVLPLHMETQDQTLMDLAESYLKELELKSMVQVQVDESTGRIKSFHLPEFFRDLYLSKPNPNKFHLHDLRSHRLERDPEIFSPSDSSLDLETNKVAICLRDHGDLDNYVPPKRQFAKELRSELFFLQNYNHRSRISLLVQSHLSDLKMVRVLDLGGLVFSKLDRVIVKLIHLRYLGLRYTIFHELPSTIGNMKHLQTLDLWDDDTQYASVTIPNVLWKLEQLKHFYLRSLVWSNKERNKLRCDSMSKLEIFENFDSRVFNVEDLFSLTNLRRLRAKTCKKFDLERIAEYLEDGASRRLREFSLSIKYCDLYSEEGQSLLERVFKSPKLHELDINGRTGRLPMYHNDFSPCLTKISLESCELKDDPMVTLEKLPNLRSLFVKWNAFVGKEMVCSATGFPQLRILQLRRIRSLENWRVEEGAMPKFSSLEIISCPALQMIPDGLQFVSTLKELVIGLMPESFTSRLRIPEDGKYGDDLHKVRHASIKVIYYDGKEEIVQKNMDVAIGEEVVIGKTGVSPWRTISCNNTRPDKGKGKAPKTEWWDAEPSMDDDDNDFMPR